MKWEVFYEDLHTEAGQPGWPSTRPTGQREKVQTLRLVGTRLKRQKETLKGKDSSICNSALSLRRTDYV